MPDLVEGFVSLIGGMDGRTAPEILPENRYARGLNVSSRSGLIHTRPGFPFFPAALPANPNDKFQGAALYRLNGVDRIICVIKGIVYGINLNTLAITTYKDTLDATVDRCHFCQADKFMIVQDGVNKAVIINYSDDPDDCERAGANEVPVGTIMAYGHGRLFVVVLELGGVDVGQRFFVAGDIIKPNDVSDVLQFTETTYLAGGGAFALPNELGYITAMKFLRNAPTGTGFGSLIVMAKNGASAFAVNQPRTDWQDTDLSQVLFTGSGSLSPFSVIPVNNDLFFRGRVGLRTIGYTLAASGGSSATHAVVPLSEPADEFFEGDTDAEQAFVSMAHVNSRVFCTAKPHTVSGEVRFQGLVSIDAAVISSFGQNTEPIFDGIWTGYDFLHVLRGVYDSVERLFAFVRSETGSLFLCYLDEYAEEDADSTRLQCRTYTRVFSFLSDGRNSYALADKRLRYVDLWIRDLEGQADIKVYYRPIGYELWNQLGSTVTVQAAAGSLSQRRDRIRFNAAKGTFDPITKRDVMIGNAFQFCIEWTGKLTLQKMSALVQPVEESETIACKADDTAQTLSAGAGGVVLSDYEYDALGG